MHVDLDYVYDPNPIQQEANLGLLLDRVKTMGVSTVYLQAFADPDGDGEADALYFYNRHLPMRTDLFNRVAWQLRTRVGVQVYAWMPLLAFALGDESDQVQAWRADAEPTPDPAHYRRLSPFSAHARRLIGEIYEDLAKHTPIAGVLFHDDAFLSDFEDAHPEALAAYRNAGLPDDIGALRDDERLLGLWTRLKADALHELTGELAARLRYWRPGVKTARNLYARTILEPTSFNWFAQSLPNFLEHYDYTAVMAMPYMEKAADADAWLATLAARIEEIPGAFDKVVFELQSVDWRRDNEPVPATTLVRQMRLLERWGARHYGYYPDDFFNDQPTLKMLLPVMSLRTYPHLP
jgi:biofilm PGA synthesis lipoprotein PgaB